jgi:DNA-binding LacI/PurR family transcriptional regulator
MKGAALKLGHYRSVSTPRSEIGKVSAKMIIDIIRGSGGRPAERRIDFGYKIIDRESTISRR